MTGLITLPGIGGSGPAHWQTLWEQNYRGLRRFQPASWDQPDLADWIAALDRAVRAEPSPPLIIAHSLANVLLAHWASRKDHPAIKGALMVAPPDPFGPNYPSADAPSFCGALPVGRLPFPAVVLSSSNDPYSAPAFARAAAVGWGAALVELGPLGHINSASGLEDWPQGWGLLTAFAAGLGVVLGPGVD